VELVEFEEEKVAGEAMVDGVLEFVEKTLNPARTGAFELPILTAAPAPRLTCVRSKCGIGAAATDDTLLVAGDGAKKWNPDTSRLRAVNLALVFPPSPPPSAPGYSDFGNESA